MPCWVLTSLVDESHAVSLKLREFSEPPRFDVGLTGSQHARSLSCSVRLATENYGDLRKTPLFFAISNGDGTCAKMLLAAGAKPDLDPLRCILVAVRAER